MLITPLTFQRILVKIKLMQVPGVLLTRDVHWKRKIVRLVRKISALLTIPINLKDTQEVCPSLSLNRIVSFFS